ncbi:MAG: T9SS type A sorting domain-containing protein [Bacteroidia bacterium]|nr:T9SS type A sorting domain-containing protein [Bacteroidia bacterium]
MIKNFGTQTISSIPLSFKVNGSVIATETYSGTLAAGATANYMFTATADFSVPGIYNVTAYTQLSNETNFINDTAHINITQINPQNTPYTMGFEASEDVSGWTVIDANGDGKKWNVISNSSCSHSSFRTAAYPYHATNTANDLYVTPCINFNAGSTYKLKFWYRVKSSSWPEKLKVYCGTSPQAGSLTNLVTDLGTISNQSYLCSSTNFTVSASGVYNMGFYAYSAANMDSLYIDDISIYEVLPVDAAIASLTLPQPTCELDSFPVITTIKNYGAGAISNFQVNYTVNGGSPVTENITSSILPDSSLSYTFIHKVHTPVPGDYIINVSVSGVPGDANAYDDQKTDTARKTIPETISYYTGFNSVAEREAWKIEDVNADGKTWYVNNTSGYNSTPAYEYSYNSSSAANDWLLSRCLYLDAGVNYKVRFLYKVQSATYPENLKVMIGTSQTSSAMTTQIVNYSNLTNTTFSTSLTPFTVSSSGVYYLGFDCYSAIDMYNLYIDDFKVYKVPTANISSAQSQCLEANTSLTVDLTGEAPWTIVYSDGSTNHTISGINTTPYTFNVSPGVTTTYSLVSITDANDIGSVGSFTATVYQHPTASLTASAPLCTGNTANVSVNLTGKHPWTLVYNNGVHDTTVNNIVTTPYVFSVTPTDTINYILISINDSTGCSGILLNDTVHVYLTPDAAVTPSSQVFCSGFSTGFVLSSNTAGTQFNWTVTQSGAAGATASTALSGDTIAQVLSATGTSAGTVNYTIIPSTGFCTGSTLSTIVTVHPPLSVSATPPSHAICSGSDVNFVLNTNIPGSAISWLVDQTDVNGAAQGTGDTINQTLTTTGFTDGTADYTITVSYPNCHDSTIHAVAVVHPIPDVAAVPPLQDICSGFAPAVALSSNVAGAQFSWTVNQTGISGATPATGDTIAQVLTVTGTSTGTAQYTITPATAFCTGSQISATVTVYPQLTVTSTPTSQAICSGAATNIALNANIPGSSITWTVVQTNVNGASADSGDTINQVLNNPGSVDGSVNYTITVSHPACNNTTVHSIITVYPIPNASATPPSQSICTFSTATIGLSSNVNGAQFSWTAAYAPVITGAANGTGSVISQSLYNTGNNPEDVTYTIIPGYHNCFGTPITAIITVNPYPVVSANPTNSSICSGETTNISLTSSISYTSYTWTALSPAQITGAADGSGSIIFQTLTNSDIAPHQVTYHVIPSASGCTGSAVNISVEVKPKPEATIAAASDTVFCMGGSVILTANAGSGLTYQWQKNENNIYNATGSSYTAAANGSYNALVTNNYNCTSHSNNISVTINANPAPVIHSDGYLTACVPDTVILSTTFQFIEYLWSNGDTVSQTGVTTAGNYSVTVTDVNGCTGNSQITLNEISIAAPDICIALVDSTINKNIIVWEKEQTGVIEFYKIYKESNGGIYNPIGMVPYDSLSLFVDALSLPDQNYSRYKLAKIDTCGNETGMSARHRTLHLSVMPATGGYNLLWPDNYEGFTFNFYRIYKWQASSGWVELAVVPGTVNFYTDTALTPGITRYMIAAIKPGGNCIPTAMFKTMSSPFTQSLSNTVEVVISNSDLYGSEDLPLAYISPNPMKDKCRIVFSDKGIKAYTLTLYDITGKKVRLSENISSGEFYLERGALSSGIYTLEIKCDKIFRKKLVVE